MQIPQAVYGLAAFLIPGFLLTYVFFRRGSLSRLERIATGLAVSLSMSILLMYSLNRLFGIKLNLSLLISILLISLLAGVTALLISRRDHGRITVPRVRFSPSGLSHYLGLVLILVFAFFMVYVPHLNYAYPLHIDEWYHYGWSQALTDAQTLTFAEPFLGEVPAWDHDEVGFHILLSALRSLTGLPWITLFLLFPGIIYVFTVLVIYTIGQRSGYGLEAAFFAALIPTTVRFLGPAFVVPVSPGLFLFAVVLFLLHCHETTGRKVIVLFLMLALLFLLHVPTAVLASLLCIIYGLLDLWATSKRGIVRWRHALVLLGVVSLASLIGFGRNWSLTMETVAEIPKTMQSLPLVTSALSKYGLIPLAFCAVGFGSFAFSKDKKSWGLPLSFGTLLVIVYLYNYFQLGIQNLNDRTFLYLLLLAGILAGLGSMKIRTLVTRSSHPNRMLVALPLLVIFLSMSAAGVLSVRSHFEEPYYHLITEKQYLDGLWIKENLAGYGTVLVEPRMAIAFSAVTGKPVYVTDVATLPWREQRIFEAEDFLRGNSANTSWLLENDIDIVYTGLPVRNPDLTRVHDGVYVVPEVLRDAKNP